eukprot:TRINITY_DN10326_c0_g1_i4.p1 TRINITY_DN10326_c0_g1~~TRINITY_DN10326_c0_g1_i4.p1  ORF type:complete len:143 (-),score=35.28 TRINITY_DN10326_c0_g1_i4:112-540(-)
MKSVESKTMEDWDHVDWTAEFERVNGDPRAFGEMNRKEKTHMELLKAYYHDPKSVEKLANTVGQYQQTKRLGKPAKAGVDGTPHPNPNHAGENTQPKSAHPDRLRELLRQKGIQGEVFSGKDYAQQIEQDGVAYQDRVQVIE